MDEEAAFKFGRQLGHYMPPEDFVELAVRICLGCFDPEQGLNLGRLLDPHGGIDIFLHQAPLMRNHICSGPDGYPWMRNMWKETVLKLPLELYESLKADPVISAGAAVTALEWRR